MARPLRVNYPGAIYHVTCRGNEQRAIFRDDTDRLEFLNRLSACVTEYQLVLHAYVLMDNHFHLLLEAQLGNLSEAMRQFNVAYTVFFNRKHQRVGHLYQGRFKAIVVEADSYLLELSRYIHLNPIRIKRYQKIKSQEKLKRLKIYPWSSLGGYLNPERRKSFMTYSRVLEYLGGENKKGYLAYGRFIEEGIQKGVDSPWEKVVGGVLLGEEGFVQKIGKLLGTQKDKERPSILAVTRTILPKKVKEIVEQIIKEEGIREEKIKAGIMMECLHRYGQMSQAEIGKQVGEVGYSRVSQLRRYLREA
ncbi:MAG: transposase, partial [Nitrospirae bacterium]|nr:transposase [Nitrospirota bacterium]